MPAPGRPVPGMLRAAVGAVLVVAAWLLSSPPTPMDTAGPAASRPADLFELPTRGSLAGDDSWLTRLSRRQDLAGLPAERHVLFAGDLGQLRVALVLGGGPASAVAAWLTGPVGAAPGSMDLAAPLTSADASGPIALWDTPKAAWMGAVLVVVTMPGERIGFVGGAQVDAVGIERHPRRPLPVVDGVASVAVRAPLAHAGADPSSGRVVVDRSPSDVVVVPQLSDRARRLAELPVEPADPRGLRAGVDEEQLQRVLHDMIGTYGLRPQQVAPVILAAGPADRSGEAAVLVGATMLSGATVTWLSVSRADGSLTSGPLPTSPEPAGTPLLDRVLAVWAAPRTAAVDRLPRRVVVSGPRPGTVAEALAADGSTLAVAPLTEGAGVLAMPPESTMIRIRGAHGRLLGEGPIAEPPAERG
jgi:hypothetical protein